MPQTEPPRDQDSIDTPLASRRGRDEPSSHSEIRSWCMYSFAREAAQILYMNLLGPILLLDLAQGVVQQRAVEGLDSLEEITLPGLPVKPGSFPMVVMWVSVVLRFLFYVCMGSLGDYGGLRKKLLVAMTFLGAFFVGLNVICYRPDRWLLAGFLFVISSVCFGLCDIYYNSYLPILVAAQPQVLDCPDGDSYSAVSRRISNEMSGKAVLCAMCGGISLLVLYMVGSSLLGCVGPDCTQEATLVETCIGICVSALWWLVFSQITFCNVKTRPAPTKADFSPLYGLRQSWGFLQKLRESRDCSMFFLAYIIYFDALSTIMQIGVLIMRQDLMMTGGQLAIVNLMVYIGGIAGSLFTLLASKTFQVTTRAMLLLYLGILTMVCIWGCLGLNSHFRFGFKVQFEGYICGLVLGFCIAPITSLSRAVCADLTPVGQEAEMFSFYALFDKATSWIGPMVALFVYNFTSNFRGTFIYLALSIAFGMVALHCVDIERGMEAAGRGNGGSSSVKQ